MEIPRVPELLHSSLSLFVKLFQTAANCTWFEHRFTLTPALSQRERELGCQVCDAGGKLVEQVYLLDQAADRLGDGVEGLARGVLCGVLTGQRLSVLLAEGAETPEELLPVSLIERRRLA